MELDNPDAKEFASWRSYDTYADRVRHSSRYVWDPAIQAFLATVIATIEQRDQTLPTGRILFRAQQGVEVFDQHDEQGNWIGEYTSGSRRQPFQKFDLGSAQKSLWQSAESCAISGRWICRSATDKVHSAV